MPEKTGNRRAIPLNPNPNAKFGLKIISVLLIFLVDQFSKSWVISQFQVGESRPIVPHVIWLSLVHNTGTAFGLFPGANTFFVVFSITVILFLFFLIFRENEWHSIALLLGGAIGNLMDRVRWGYVIDFMDLRIWPVFNVADSCITMGILWLLYNTFKQSCTQFSSK